MFAKFVLKNSIKVSVSDSKGMFGCSNHILSISTTGIWGNVSCIFQHI